MLALAVGTLAGCTGGDPAPDWTPTTATPVAHPTPTPSADPATIKPERPAAMDQPDAAGAEATAVYFLGLVPYANAVGDAAELSEFSHPECGFCASAIDGVEQLARAGEHTVGGVPTISDVSSLEVDPGRWWTVDVDLVQSPQHVLDSNGDVVADVAGDAFHMDVAVAWESDRWQVHAVSYKVLSGTEG